MQTTAERISNDISASLPGNRAQLLDRWYRYLEHRANDVGVTVDELLSMAGMPKHLPQPTRPGQGPGGAYPLQPGDLG